MNRKSLVAALVLIASAGSVLADDITIENQPVLSGQRTQVQAQPQQFERAAVNVYAYEYNPLHSFAGGKTRAEVRAEFVASRTEVAAMTAEDSGSAWLSAQRGQQEGTAVAGQPANAQ